MPWWSYVVLLVLALGSIWLIRAKRSYESLQRPENYPEWSDKRLKFILKFSKGLDSWQKEPSRHKNKIRDAAKRGRAFADQEADCAVPPQYAMQQAVRSAIFNYEANRAAFLDRYQVADYETFNLEKRKILDQFEATGLIPAEWSNRR